MISHYPNEQNPVWIDLYMPTPQEENTLEMQFGIEVPTPEEMAEIELSNRLYQENGIIYTTVVVVSKADTDLPQTAAITFILTPKCLVTLRYTESRAFDSFKGRLQKSPCGGAEQVYNGLMEAIINRTADILEKAAQSLDMLSKKVFREKKPGKNFRAIVKSIGANGDIVSQVRDSIVTISRALGFVAISGRINDGEKWQMDGLLKDVSALGSHADSLSNKAIFMLDAVLGLLSYEQNNVIKLFMVAALIFLPPTLIAGVFGMNFHHMPELEWSHGYLYAVVLMLISAVLPLAFFRYKDWI